MIYIVVLLIYVPVVLLLPANTPIYVYGLYAAAVLQTAQLWKSERTYFISILLSAFSMFLMSCGLLAIIWPQAATVVPISSPLLLILNGGIGFFMSYLYTLMMKRNGY